MDYNYGLGVLFVKNMFRSVFLSYSSKPWKMKCENSFWASTHCTINWVENKIIDLKTLFSRFDEMCRLKSSKLFNHGAI